MSAKGCGGQLDGSGYVWSRSSLDGHVGCAGLLQLGGEWQVEKVVGL